MYRDVSSPQTIVGVNGLLDRYPQKRILSLIHRKIIIFESFSLYEVYVACRTEPLSEKAERTIAEREISSLRTLAVLDTIRRIRSNLAESALSATDDVTSVGWYARGNELRGITRIEFDFLDGLGCIHGNKAFNRKRAATPFVAA